MGGKSAEVVENEENDRYGGLQVLKNWCKVSDKENTSKVGMVVREWSACNCNRWAIVWP